MIETPTVIAFSGGKDSTAMALRLIELEPEGDYRLICTPTGNELPEMFEHWKSISVLIGKPIVPIVAGSLVPSVRSEGMIPNFRARWCTRKLKIIPYQGYLQKLVAEHGSVTSCVGIRDDEPEREAGDYSKVIGVTSRFPLREWGWGINQVLAYLESKGVSIPSRTDCALCYWQRLGEWWNLWKDHPEMYAEGEALEGEMGHTFRSESRDTWPASLRELRLRFEKGKIPSGSSAQGELFQTLQCRVCRI